MIYLKGVNWPSESGNQIREKALRHVSFLRILLSYSLSCFAKSSLASAHEKHRGFMNIFANIPALVGKNSFFLGWELETPCRTPCVLAAVAPWRKGVSHHGRQENLYTLAPG